MVNVSFDLSLEDTRTLYQAVCDAIEMWPGSPRRPPEEQVNYQQLKLFLFSILCEASLDAWAKTLKAVATLLAPPKKRAKAKGSIPRQIMVAKRAVDKESNIN